MRLISLEKDKNIKVSNNIEYFLNPDFIYVPASSIFVKQDERIYKGMPVCENYLSPVSGVAFGVKKCLFSSGWHNSLVIENDFREVGNGDLKRNKKLTIKNILKCLEENNAKNLLEKFKSQTEFDNIVITTINDEPYIYNNIFALKENILELLELFDELSFIYKSNHNYLVIKNVDTAIIIDCLNTIGTYPNIELTLVNDEYLLEKEEFLKEKIGLTGNTLYLSTIELLFLNNYLKGKYNDTVLITITGDAIKRGKVMRIKKYTHLKEVLDKWIEIVDLDNYIVFNGLMQGNLVSDINNFIIDDKVFAINIMKKRNDVTENCINCGKCIDICPVGVNPLSGKNKDKCISCGLCSYICPGFVNLKNRLRNGK